MNSNTFRMPARRRAVAAVTTTVAATASMALAVTPLALAGPAHATGGGGEGRASAVVFRTGLDISLLNKTVNLPLTTSLNAVEAPASADKSVLSVRLDGVDNGEPFQVLRAQVATARATAEKKRSEGYANLARAQVHVPGLPLLSLIEVEKVTSKAVCEAGKRPVAESNVLGRISVLGKNVELSAAGRTAVTVPGVGEVTLDLSRTQITSRTAAATALELKVAVNPLKLNVAEVNGTVTLVKATCQAPKAAPEEEKPVKPEEPAQEKPSEGPAPQGDDDPDLAETGGSSATPYVAGGALALLVIGGGAVVATRRRAAARARG
ncbi:SCO1860 family LAETG-anchored protein [Streptomyces sp. NPDC057638]|uniref:SCO1860 family LAETG-anchored protein n=1 Tax=Streptomyces sp. NPDC057638 TaxID=3346190 RepID=UPI0036A9A68B